MGREVSRAGGNSSGMSTSKLYGVKVAAKEVGVEAGVEAGVDAAAG